MGKKSYDEVSVLRIIEKNAGINVKPMARKIEIVKGATSVGNGTLGKIDYLCNYCGWTKHIISADDKYKAKIEEAKAKKAAIEAEKAEHNKPKVNLLKAVKANIRKPKLSKSKTM